MDPVASWLRSKLPPWADATLGWLLEPELLALLAASSLVFFLLGVLGVPYLIARAPVDFFSRQELALLGLDPKKRPLWYLGLRGLKNVLGLLLLAAGIAMLFLPGQGLLTVAVALSLLDFPGKKRLQRRLLAVEPIFRGLNALRQRRGIPPFRRSTAAEPTPATPTMTQGHAPGYVARSTRAKAQRAP